MLKIGKQKLFIQRREATPPYDIHLKNDAWSPSLHTTKAGALAFF